MRRCKVWYNIIEIHKNLCSVNNKIKTESTILYRWMHVCKIWLLRQTIDGKNEIWKMLMQNVYDLNCVLNSKPTKCMSMKNIKFKATQWPWQTCWWTDVDSTDPNVCGDSLEGQAMPSGNSLKQKWVSIVAPFRSIHTLNQRRTLLPPIWFCYVFFNKWDD